MNVLGSMGTAVSALTRSVQELLPTLTGEGDFQLVFTGRLDPAVAPAPAWVLLFTSGAARQVAVALLPFDRLRHGSEGSAVSVHVFPIHDVIAGTAGYLHADGQRSARILLTVPQIKVGDEYAQGLDIIAEKPETVPSAIAAMRALAGHS
jgi:hypothetical protein